MMATFDLFPALEKRLREQARTQERESLPRLRDSSMDAARDWLDALEQWPGRDRVLLCLNEFERLEEVVRREAGDEAAGDRGLQCSEVGRTGAQ